MSLSWASSIQSIPPHLTSWRSILILSFHLRLEDINKCGDYKGRPLVTIHCESSGHPKCRKLQSKQLARWARCQPVINQPFYIWSKGKPFCSHMVQLPSQGLRLLLSIQSIQSSAITIMIVCLSREERAIPRMMLCYQGCEGYKTCTPPRTSLSHPSPFSCRTVQVTDKYIARVTAISLLHFISFFANYIFTPKRNRIQKPFMGKPYKSH